MTAQQFPYVPRDPSLGNASLAPMLPLTLIGRQSVATTALVDSGAATNVLPYSLGVQLGFGWDQETRSVELSGNLAAVEARVVVLSAVVRSFPPVRLAFAWAQTDAVSVILGQGELLLGVRCLLLSFPRCVRGAAETVRKAEQAENCRRSRRRVGSTKAPVEPIRTKSINGRTPIGQPAQLDRSTDNRIWLRTCGRSPG